MKSIVYIGMDVHKNSYSLCALHKETGEILGESRIASDISISVLTEQGKYDTFSKDKCVEKEFSHRKTLQ